MKIDKYYKNYDSNIYKKEKKEGKITKNSINQENGDKIDISNSAKNLVKKINESEDGMFTEKVEKIRRSIQQGAYKVSTDKIADKILDLIKEQKNGG